MKKLNTTLLVLLVVINMSIAIAMTTSEFKELNEEELTNWEYELIETTTNGQEEVYHFYMNNYEYYEINDSIRYQKEPFIITCNPDEQNCSTFLENQLQLLQDSLYLEYLEMQDEL